MATNEAHEMDAARIAKLEAQVENLSELLKTVFRHGSMDSPPSPPELQRLRTFFGAELDEYIRDNDAHDGQN